MIDDYKWKGGTKNLQIMIQNEFVTKEKLIEYKSLEIPDN